MTRYLFVHLGSMLIREGTLHFNRKQLEGLNEIIEKTKAKFTMIDLHEHSFTDVLKSMEEHGFKYKDRAFGRVSRVPVSGGYRMIDGDESFRFIGLDIAYFIEAVIKKPYIAYPQFAKEYELWDLESGEHPKFLGMRNFIEGEDFRYNVVGGHLNYEWTKTLFSHQHKLFASVNSFLLNKDVEFLGV